MLVLSEQLLTYTVLKILNYNTYIQQCLLVQSSNKDMRLWFSIIAGCMRGP